MRIKVIASASLLCLGLAGCVTTPPSEDPVLIKLTEIDERLEAGEERFAEILDEVLEFAVDALERAIDDEIEWDEEAPSA